MVPPGERGKGAGKKKIKWTGERLNGQGKEVVGEETRRRKGFHSAATKTLKLAAGGKKKQSERRTAGIKEDQKTTKTKRMGKREERD